MSKVITNETQLNTEVDDLITENYALEVLGLKNPADFRKFSRSFMKLSKIVKGIDDSNVGKLDKGAVSSEYDTGKKIEDKIKEKITKANTIEQLKTMNFLKVGDIVEVLGYYSAGDGAGHKRIIKAEDDGSGVQLSNNLWACIVHNGEVNVSWFGAKGDGVTDDTEAIKKSLSNGNVIYLDSNKIYCISEMIRVWGRGKILTTNSTVERTSATIKYIGALNNKSAVVIVGGNNFGQTNVDTTANALINVNIDANNLCGVGVYSTFFTNESKIEGVCVYHALEYGVYVARGWYGTLRNITAYSCKGCGIALGMDLRFSDGTVVLSGTDLQLNNLFISNLRAIFCGKEADFQDYSYGYGIGIGEGYSLNVDRVLAEGGGIGILIKRTGTKIFSVKNIYTESNKKGLILDTRKDTEMQGYIGNGYIKEGIENIDEEGHTGAFSGITIENIYQQEHTHLPANSTIQIKNCSYTLNQFIQPSNTKNLLVGYIRAVAYKQNLKNSIDLYIPESKCFKPLFYAISDREITNISGSFSCIGKDGNTIASFSYPETIKKGVNLIRNIPEATVRIVVARQPSVSVPCDVYIVDRDPRKNFI